MSHHVLNIGNRSYRYAECEGRPRRSRSERRQNAERFEFFDWVRRAFANVEIVPLLSGNRNFEGRIHPSVRDAFLASPPLVVAYTLAGSTRIDIENAPLTTDIFGRPVYLRRTAASRRERHRGRELRAHTPGESRGHGHHAAAVRKPARAANRSASTGPRPIP